MQLRRQPDNGSLLRTHLCTLLSDLLLLLLDGVQHRPDDWVIVHQKVSFAVFSHSLRNDLLNFLRNKSDVLFAVMNIHGVLVLVAVAHRTNAKNLAQARRVSAFQVLQATIGERTPRTAASFVGAAIHRESVIR